MEVPALNTPITKLLNIQFPMILAPMFLVSNTQMVVAATEAGITAAIPAMNYRTNREFRISLAELKEKAQGPVGINLIANKSNIRLQEQLQSCLDFQIDYVITSLGNPAEIIRKCHEKGILVFCDVVDEEYGKKVSDLGADGIIAVNKDAGGHAGKLDSRELISRLGNISDLPIISAGGVGTGSQLLEKIKQGASGVSVGSVFIATSESPVSDEYKNACVKYSAKDIVMSTKLSGTPCTVINTPYVQKTGTKQNMLEAILNKNKRLKKYAKMITFFRGMKSIKKAAFSHTYKEVWCAGPTIEYVKEVLPVKNVIQRIIQECVVNSDAKA